ncbi:hypothetical protein [Photobacterium damselae]
MKCKIIIKPNTEISPTITSKSYHSFSLNNSNNHEYIAISTNSNNVLILILSDGNIQYNGRSFPKLAIAPMGNDCYLDIEIYHKSYVFCYDLNEEINQELCSGLYRFISPYNYIVEQLHEDINDEADAITVMALKHLALLSLTRKKTISDFYKIKQFIYSNIRNSDLSLDYLSDNLFMSRRKIQYILSRNDTSYGSLVDDIRFEILSQEDLSLGLTFQQILSKAGVKNIATANRIFMKKVGKKMRDFLNHENK